MDTVAPRLRYKTRHLRCILEMDMDSDRSRQPSDSIRANRYWLNRGFDGKILRPQFLPPQEGTADGFRTTIAGVSEPRCRTSKVFTRRSVAHPLTPYAPKPARFGCWQRIDVSGRGDDVPRNSWETGRRHRPHGTFGMRSRIQS